MCDNFKTVVLANCVSNIIGKVVNVVSPSCGTLEWDAPDASVGLTYKIRFYSSTPSSPEVVLSSPTNSLTFTGLDVPTQRPLDVTVSLK